MSELQRLLRVLVHVLAHRLPGFYGNDGLTWVQRRSYAERYRATVGHRPAATEARLAELHELAEKAPGRTWHRPGLSAKSA